MRLATYQIFDQQISGTTPVYSKAEFNRPMGEAELYAVHAVTTSVSPAGASLRVQSEYSADSQNWLAVSTNAEIAGATMVNNGSLSGVNITQNNLPLMPPAFIRFSVNLGAPSHSCRLKLYFTGHTRSRKA